MEKIDALNGPVVFEQLLEGSLDPLQSLGVLLLLQGAQLDLQSFQGCGDGGVIIVSLRLEQGHDLLISHGFNPLHLGEGGLSSQTGTSPVSQCRASR